MNALGAARRLKRDIGAVHSGGNDLPHRVIPGVALVLVLALGTEIGNLLLHLARRIQSLSPPQVAPYGGAARRRPE